MKFVLDSAIRFGFDLAVKATFVFAFTSVALLLLRRSSAATRHRVGLFGLGAALLLPFLSAALPQVNVPILPDVRPAAPSHEPAPMPMSMPVAGDVAPAAADEEAAVSWRQLALAVPEKAMPVSPEETFASETSSEDAAATVPATEALPATGSGFAPGVLLFAWIAGAAAVGLRLAVGWSRVRRIGREARPIRDVEWLLERDAAARRLEVSRRVELVESEAVPVAMTFGILRPLLMFGRAARQWAIERRRIVLLHELAHVKRADWPALLLAELSAAVYWFHPLAWWLTRRVRRDAETACDDLVIASGTKPSVYAGHLLGIFRALGSPAHPTPALALGLGGARPHHFEARLRTILDPLSTHRGESRGQTRLAIVALAGAATVMGFVSPWVPREETDAPFAFVSDLEIASLDETDSASPSPSPSGSPSPSPSGSPSPSPSGSASPSASGSQKCKSSHAAEPSGFLPVVARAESPAPEAEAAPEEEPAPEAQAEPATVPAIWTPAASPSGQVEGFVKAGNKKHSKREGSEWYSEGMELHHDGEYEAAIEAFQKSIEAGYNEDAATYNIACGYALLGKNDLAFEYLKKAMDEGFDVGGYLHDDDLDGLHSDPRWPQLKKDARENGDGQFVREQRAASTRYQRIVARNPKSGEAFFDVGIELLRSEQYDLSAQAYQNAIDRGYRLGTAYYNQACAYALGGKTDAAFASLRKSLDNGFDSPDHLAKDDDLDSLHGDPRWAGIRKDAKDLSLPNYNQHWWNAGSRGERIKWREAAERAQKYVEKNPQSGRGWYNVGFASLAGDRPEASIEAFQKALALGYRKPATMYNIACAYSRLDQKDPAFDWLNKAIDAGFDSTHTIRSDEDLDNLRGDPRYRKALQTARAKERDEDSGSGDD
jgi:beta-lactamase regulating signal transducer with metallopeptidase domain/Tfp pilus assembly protein PilF